MKKFLSVKGTGIGIGVILGCIIGTFTDNIGLWLPLGVLFGVAIEQTLDKCNEEEE